MNMSLDRSLLRTLIKNGESFVSSSEPRRRLEWSGWIPCLIVESGPSGEPDFDDARYWVKSASISVDGGIVTSTVRDADDPSFMHVCASNVLELASGSHARQVGETVMVRIAQVPGDEGNYRHWFSIGGVEVVAYICGIFNASESATAWGLAIANGGEWRTRQNSDIDPTVQSSITDFAVFDGKLYASGIFVIGGQTKYFAVWDEEEEEWTNPPSGNTQPLDAEVKCLLVPASGDKIILGGYGGFAGGSGAASYDGSSYTVMGAGDPINVRALIEWNGVIYAGTINPEGEPWRGALLSWSGSEWEGVGAGVFNGQGNGEEIRGFAIHDDCDGEKLFFVGTFERIDGRDVAGKISRRIGAWDGSNYVVIDEEGFADIASSVANSCCALEDRLLIVGKGLSPGGLAAIWDGRRLTASPWSFTHHSTGGVTPAPDIRIAQSNGKRALVGGLFYAVSFARVGVPIDAVARADEAQGAFVPVRNNGLNGRVRNLVALGSERYAAGSFTRTIPPQALSESGDDDSEPEEQGDPCAYFAVATDDAWEQVGELPGPAFCAAAATLDGIDGIFIGGGSFARWFDGTDVLAGPAVNGPIHRARVIGGALYVVGGFTEIAGTTCKGVASLTLSGTTWTATALATIGDVIAHDIAGDGTYLYVLGIFTQIGNGNGTAQALRVARYVISSDTWEAMGAGLPSVGNTIEVHEGAPWAGIATGYRKWSGSAWVSAGGPAGITATRGPEIMRVIDGTLYIDHGGGPVERTRLVTHNSTDGFVVVFGGADPINETVFDAAIHDVVELDSGGGTQIHVGGDFHFIGEELGEIVWPRNCLAACYPNGRCNAFLGGVGERNYNASTFGLSSHADAIRFLDVPGLTGTSVCVGGAFTVASNVNSSGIAGLLSSGRMSAIGAGLHPTTLDNGMGAKAALVASDGYLYIVGKFTEARNDLLRYPSAPLVVQASGIVAHRSGVFEEIEVAGELFSDASSVVEFGEPGSNGRARIWVLHDGDETVAERDPDSGTWTERGSNILSVGTNCRLIVFNGDLYAIGVFIIDDGGSVETGIIRYEGGGVWSDAAPADFGPAGQATLADLGGGLRLIVCRDTGDAGEPAVWHGDDTGTWSAVGPASGAGSLQGGVQGVGSVGDRLFAVGGTVGGEISGGASYDPELGTWESVGTVAVGNFSQFGFVGRPRATMKALIAGERLKIDTATDFWMNHVAEWTPVDGWRQVRGRWGVNDPAWSVFPAG